MQFDHFRPFEEWHRPRSDGGFDLVALAYHRHHKPLFTVSLGKVPKDSALVIGDIHVPSEKITVFDLDNRVLLRRKRLGFWAWLLPFARSRSFYITATATLDEAERESTKVCEEFIDLFRQAEDYWQRDVYGPNLVPFTVGLRPKKPVESELK